MVLVCGGASEGFAELRHLLLLFTATHKISSGIWLRHEGMEINLAGRDVATTDLLPNAPQKVAGAGVGFGSENDRTVTTETRQLPLIAVVQRIFVPLDWALERVVPVGGR